MSVSRRRLFSAFAEIGALAAASRVLPASLWAQGASPRVAPGKEKLIIRSLRPLVVELRTHDTNLADQLKRAATSVALNLAEGIRRTGRDKRHAYRIAAAEAQEVKAALTTVADWGYLDDDALAPSRALADRVGALTFGLAK